MSKFDSILSENRPFYFRYMDDILTSCPPTEISDLVTRANGLHGNFKFTTENEVDCKLRFLDILITRMDSFLSTEWFRKKTDTGLCLNYHAMRPSKYRHSVVFGFVHRVFRSCSTWTFFDDCLNKLKNILEGNQYPPAVYNPIIRKSNQSSFNGQVGKREGRCYQDP